MRDEAILGETWWNQATEVERLVALQRIAQEHKQAQADAKKKEGTRHAR